jgi:2-phospho-L-lactate guanylyltransferase
MSNLSTGSISSSISGSALNSRQSGANFSLWLIVPVKPFGEGKSRLSAVLSPALRAEFSRRWLTHVLTTAIQWAKLTGVVVISHDYSVLALGSALGAHPVREEGDDLNSALVQARQVALDAGAEALLVLPSDLPLLAREDLDELHDLALEGNGVIIAPSHDGGTNALLLRPPEAIDYAFGEASFARHLALAAAARIPYRVYNSSTLALDIDYPEDLLVLNS